MKKILVMLCLFVSITSVSFAESEMTEPKAYAVGHIISTGFKEEGDSIMATGPLLHVIDKSAYSTVATLDSLYISNDFSIAEIGVHLLDQNKKTIGSNVFEIPKDNTATRINIQSKWDLEELEPGLYYFGVTADEGIVAAYMVRIIEG